MSDPEVFDAIIIGGGPGGATAGLVMARAGLRVALFERATFPRFRIGESLVPRNTPLFRELGLLEPLMAVPQMAKYGVEFAMGHELESTCFNFARGLLPGEPTMNVERAGFDSMLLEQARISGAQIHQGVGVKKINRLTEGDVSVSTDAGEFRGKYLIDASGQGTMVARHLQTRKPYHDARLQKVAYFAHFENVKRREGIEEGHPFIVMCEEGWFWLIPIDARRTSVGFVTSPDFARGVGVAANRMLEWAAARCPAVFARTGGAIRPETNMVAADFSYTCKPYAGPGYFLIGDAAAFVDPIFSTGVTLSMITANEAAKHLIAIFRAGRSPKKAHRQYARFVEVGTGVFFKVIRQYYRHSFRELFLNGTGPMKVHSAVLSILAGQVFPRPPFSLWWRLQLFHFFVGLNEKVSLVPRRQHFSLLSQPPISMAPGLVP